MRTSNSYRFIIFLVLLVAARDGSFRSFGSTNSGHTSIVCSTENQPLRHTWPDLTGKGQNQFLWYNWRFHKNIRSIHKHVFTRNTHTHTHTGCHCWQSPHSRHHHRRHLRSLGTHALAPGAVPGVEQAGHYTEDSVQPHNEILDRSHNASAGVWLDQWGCPVIQYQAVVGNLKSACVFSPLC